MSLVLSHALVDIWPDWRIDFLQQSNTSRGNPSTSGGWNRSLKSSEPKFVRLCPIDAQTLAFPMHLALGRRWITAAVHPRSRNRVCSARRCLPTFTSCSISKKTYQTIVLIRFSCRCFHFERLLPSGAPQLGRLSAVYRNVTTFLLYTVNEDLGPCAPSSPRRGERSPPPRALHNTNAEAAMIPANTMQRIPKRMGVPRLGASGAAAVGTVGAVPLIGAVVFDGGATTFSGAETPGAVEGAGRAGCPATLIASLLSNTTRKRATKVPRPRTQRGKLAHLETTAPEKSSKENSAWRRTAGCHVASCQ